MDSRLLWLALGAFAGSVESALVVAVLPAVALETGVSISEAGLVVFAYSIAYGFGTPLLSTLFGGVDRRRVVAGAEFAFGCGTLLFGLLPGFIAILLARTALALGAGSSLRQRSQQRWRWRSRVSAARRWLRSGSAAR